MADTEEQRFSEAIGSAESHLRPWLHLTDHHKARLPLDYVSSKTLPYESNAFHPEHMIYGKFSAPVESYSSVLITSLPPCVFHFLIS